MLIHCRLILEYYTKNTDREFYLDTSTENKRFKVSNPVTLITVLLTIKAIIPDIIYIYIILNN